MPPPTLKPYTPDNRASHAVTAGLLRKWLSPLRGQRTHSLRELLMTNQRLDYDHVVGVDADTSTALVLNTESGQYVGRASRRGSS